MYKILPFMFWLSLVSLSQATQAWDLGKAGSYKFESIAKNVYVMHGPLEEPNLENIGFMNNPGFIIGDKGIIVIDPGSTLQVGRHMLAEIKKITRKPVVAVFNSHIHGDHWLANQAIREAYPNAVIYAHPLMIKKAKGSNGLEWVDLMLRLTKGASKGTQVVVPNKSTVDQQKLTIAGQQFKLHIFKAAHTDTDLMIEHVNSKTMFMGDNSFNKRIGRFDSSSSMFGAIDVLRYVKGLDIKVFVPGHGPSGKYQQAIQPFLDYLLIIQKTVKQGFTKELEPYEIKPVVVKKLKAYQQWAGFDEQIGKQVQKMFLEIEARDL